MSAAKLGEWRWYVGSHDDDDEMMDSGTREQAMKDGAGSFGRNFYIIEARMRASDERDMGAGRRDTAPFAETRSGEWIRLPSLAALQGEGSTS